MKKTLPFLFSVALLGLGSPLRADQLELKRGTGRCDTGVGPHVLHTWPLLALAFNAPPAPPPPPPASSVTLPAGTVLLVRMMDSVSSKNAAGANFTTKLEYDLAAGTTVAVKAGTVIYGKVQSSTQARRATGQSTLDIRLASMVPAGTPIPIATSGFQQAGDASIKKAARGAGAGAAVGAIAGDAGKGAAIGATASLIKKGETVTIPPGTLLEFTLTAPVTVPVGN